MAPKQQLEKAAWEWAENTQPDNVTVDNIETAYRIKLKPCELNICRKNCAGNPFCLNGLGIKKWIQDHDDASFCENLFNPNTLKRDEGEFVGLENLGATCYINAFLQVWFHNRVLRMAVLQWSDPIDEGFRAKLTKLLTGGYEKKTLQSLLPRSPCGNLQLVFALLAFSKRRYIEPRAFIDCLEIDTTDQQDAQEFSKLFLALLEKDATMRSVIQRQYMGTYDYITCCNGCGHEALLDSTFYELDINIKGHSDLEECISEYFQEQLLKDDNKYDCKHCGVLQEAVHRVQLRSLPPVLNLQLLRFIFESGRKKKLSNYITFPETLDMSRFLPGAALYELFAVLIHSGTSASSGHYTALIKDPVTRCTYKFNDTQIEKFTDNKFNITKEEESNGIKLTSVKRPPAVKGRHASRNAYMLVYKLQSSNTNETFAEVTLDMLPEQINDYVSIDNQILEQEICEMTVGKDKCIQNGRSRLDDIQECYSMLITTPDDVRGESCDWINTDWLTKWLSFDLSADLSPVNNSDILCCHNRMDPNKIDMAKLIPSYTAEKLFLKYNGDIRLLCKESLCQECVANRCFTEFHKAKITAVDQKLKLLTKPGVSINLRPEDSVWVSKASLKKYRQFAMNALTQRASRQGIEIFQQDCKEDDAVDGCDAKLSEPVTDIDSKPSSATQISNKTIDVDGIEDKFNEAVQCIHGNLCLDAKSRSLLPINIWSLVVESFSNDMFIEFNGMSTVCHQCQCKNVEEFELIQKHKQLATVQKSELADLFSGRKRPSSESDTLYIVPTLFVSDWRKFIREPNKRDPVTAVCNDILLCDHKKFAFDLPRDNAIYDDDDSCVMYVTETEWRIICNHFAVDVEIRKDVFVDSDGITCETVSPGVCEDCCQVRRQNKYQSMFIYDSAPVFVRRVSELNFTIEHDTETDVDMSESAASLENHSTEDCLVDISDSSEQPNGSNELKRKLDTPIADDVSQAKLRRVEAPPRRSTRKRDTGSEKRFMVSSSQTLHTFKLELARAYKVLKTDQHVYLDGKELTDDSATLQQLKVRHNSVFLLKVDEPSPDEVPVESELPDNGNYVAERGFKGTLLGV